MNTCWRCGNPVREGGKFCTKCGAQMMQPEAPPPPPQKKTPWLLIVILICAAAPAVLLAGFLLKGRGSKDERPAEEYSAESQAG